MYEFVGGVNLPAMGGYRSFSTWPLGELTIDPPKVRVGLRGFFRWFADVTPFEADANDVQAQAIRRGMNNGVRLKIADGAWVVFWSRPQPVLDALERAGATVDRRVEAVKLSDLM